MVTTTIDNEQCCLFGLSLTASSNFNPLGMDRVTDRHQKKTNGTGYCMATHGQDMDTGRNVMGKGELTEPFHHYSCLFFFVKSYFNPPPVFGKKWATSTDNLGSI